ncbi:unnamed protein product [Closterium sp. NIES-54]
MSDQHGHSAIATTLTAATTATPTTATTAATKAPTPATTKAPTPATTSTASTTSTAAPTTNRTATATTHATLALAAVVLSTSRSSPDVLSTKDDNSSSRGVGGGKGGRGTPLKEGHAASATSSTYIDYTCLSCKEVLSDKHRGLVPVKELYWDISAVASVATAKVGNQVLYCGKGGQLGKQVGQ